MSDDKEPTPGDEPISDADRVGYGRPPVKNRFRKGQSGNPAGKRRRRERQRVETLIRTEAMRLLTLREGEKITKIPALQAVLRSQITAAAKGNVTAQRAIIKAVQDIEAAGEARIAPGADTRRPAKDLDHLTDEELTAIAKASQQDRS